MEYISLRSVSEYELREEGGNFSSNMNHLFYKTHSSDNGAVFDDTEDTRIPCFLL